MKSTKEILKPLYEQSLRIVIKQNKDWYEFAKNRILKNEK